VAMLRAVGHRKTVPDSAAQPSDPGPDVATDS
jgi:hypothetical protein